MTTTETTQKPHEHSFPVQTSKGSFGAPGPCRGCGKTWAVVQAERAMTEPSP